MKICNRCKVDKDDSEFRIRTDKRSNPVFVYLNSTCIKCEGELANEYREKRKYDPEYIKKHAKWAKDRYHKNKEKLIEYNKKRRSKPEAKKKMKSYREKNKDKIYQQEIITKRRYHEKNRDAITDRYAINLLRSQGYGTIEEIEKNPELIEIKKVQVLKKRIRLEILKTEK